VHFDPGLTVFFLARFPPVEGEEALLFLAVAEVVVLPPHPKRRRRRRRKRRFVILFPLETLALTRWA